MKVALITGAGSGLGQLAARRCGAKGMRVAAVDVDDAGLEQTARRAPTITPYVCDVTDVDAVELLAQRVEDELGPVDRLVNAAAIAPAGPLLEVPTEELLRIMAVNYGGTVTVTKAVLPRMIERGAGDCINFASLAGWVPTPQLGGYTASKFAVVAFTETLVYENRGSGIRFVGVCPPAVDTPMLHRMVARPKVFDALPPLRPQQVLDAVERALEAGRLWVFVHPAARWSYWMRRFTPTLVWRNIDTLERP